MTRAELLEEVREVLRDKRAPYAWSDIRLMALLSAGQDEFYRLTGFYTDTTTYTVTTVADTLSYPIPPRVLEILEVWDGGRRLAHTTQCDRPSSGALLGATSPSTWQTDHATGFLTFGENPTPGLTLSLRVHRRSVVPLNHNVSGVYDTEPELPYDELHYAFVEYAAYKAFGDHDRELQDPVKAAEHFANFRAYVQQGKDVYARLNNAPPRIAPNRSYII